MRHPLKKVAFVSLSLIISLVVYFYFFASDGFVINKNKELSLQIPGRKTKFFLSEIKKGLKDDGIFIENDQQLWDYYLKHTVEIGDSLREISYGFSSLFSDYTHDKARLNYRIQNNKELRVVEDTNFEYKHTNPIAKNSRLIDFDILVTSNFGLSSFLFDNKGQLKKEFRQNKPYYSAVSTEKYLILGGSHEPLQVIDREDYTVKHDIEGYCVSALFKDSKKVFIVAAKTEIVNRDVSDFSHYAVYEFNPEDGVLTPITDPIFGDVRGGCIYGDKLIFPEGNKNRIIVWDMKNHQIVNEINGFNWPNDVTLTPRNTFLVANEHNNEILEINFKENKILRSSPVKELRSPGSALEIDRGKFEGYWLISDTDNDRVILVEPNSWEIVYEIRDLNGPLSAVPVW